MYSHPDGVYMQSSARLHCFHCVCWMYLTEQLDVGKSVSCLRVTAALFSQLKSVMIYSAVTTTSVRIVNFQMKICRLFHFWCRRCVLGWFERSHFLNHFSNVESSGPDTSDFLTSRAAWRTELALCLQPSASLDGEINTGGGGGSKYRSVAGVREV